MKKILLILSAFVLLSCDCPYAGDLYGVERRTKEAKFSAEKLLGTWQCYYPMIIDGLEYKQIRFMPNGKAEVIVAIPREIDRYALNYKYSYSDNKLKLSYNDINVTLTVTGYLWPELYLRDSNGQYTMAIRY